MPDPPGVERPQARLVGQREAGAAPAVAARIAALDHEVGHHAVEGQAVVEALARQVPDLAGGDRGLARLEPDADGAAHGHQVEPVAPAAQAGQVLVPPSGRGAARSRGIDASVPTPGPRATTSATTAGSGSARRVLETPRGGRTASTADQPPRAPPRGRRRRRRPPRRGERQRPAAADRRSASRQPVDAHGPAPRHPRRRRRPPQRPRRDSPASAGRASPRARRAGPRASRSGEHLAFHCRGESPPAASAPTRGRPASPRLVVLDPGRSPAPRPAASPARRAPGTPRLRATARRSRQQRQHGVVAEVSVDAGGAQSRDGELGRLRRPQSTTTPLAVTASTSSSGSVRQHLTRGRANPPVRIATARRTAPRSASSNGPVAKPATAVARITGSVSAASRRSASDRARRRLRASDTAAARRRPGFAWPAKRAATRSQAGSPSRHRLASAVSRTIGSRSPSSSRATASNASARHDRTPRPRPVEPARPDHRAPDVPRRGPAARFGRQPPSRRRGPTDRRRRRTGQSAAPATGPPPRRALARRPRAPAETGPGAWLWRASSTARRSPAPPATPHAARRAGRTRRWLRPATPPPWRRWRSRRAAGRQLTRRRTMLTLRTAGDRRAPAAARPARIRRRAMETR